MRYFITRITFCPRCRPCFAVNNQNIVSLLRFYGIFVPKYPTFTRASQRISYTHELGKTAPRWWHNYFIHVCSFLFRYILKCLFYRADIPEEPAVSSFLIGRPGGGHDAQSRDVPNSWEGCDGDLMSLWRIYFSAADDAGSPYARL